MRAVSTRERAGWVAIGLGAVLLLVAVLYLSAAGHGTRTLHDFAERRSYDMVKRDVHRALPRAVTIAAAGGLLIALGRRLRRRA
jgi:hypothetical protein